MKVYDELTARGLIAQGEIRPWELCRHHTRIRADEQAERTVFQV